MNFLPDFARTKVIQFLISKAGNILVPLISGAVAAGAAYAIEKVPALRGQIDEATIVTTVWVTLVAGVNWATNHWLTKDTKTIQEALNKSGARLEVDGWAGDDTVQAIIQQTGLQVVRTEAVEPSPK